MRGQVMRMRAVAAMVVGIGLVLGTAPLASADAGSAELAQARRATAKFHVLSVADAAGYKLFLPCFDDPVEGGMGQHFARLSDVDATIDALHPEVLVYEPGKDGYKLVALEYVVPQLEKWTDENPPTLFGHDFHRNNELGIWALHAWVWRGNPSGMHADYNPNVRMCP
jgi:hypothetical protein